MFIGQILWIMVLICKPSEASLKKKWYLSLKIIGVFHYIYIFKSNAIYNFWVTILIIFSFEKVKLSMNLKKKKTNHKTCYYFLNEFAMFAQCRTAKIIFILNELHKYYTL